MTLALLAELSTKLRGALTIEAALVDRPARGLPGRSYRRHPTLDGFPEGVVGER